MVAVKERTSKNSIIQPRVVRKRLEPEFNHWNEGIANAQRLENIEVFDYHAISDRAYVMTWDADRFGGVR